MTVDGLSHVDLKEEEVRMLLQTSANTRRGKGMLTDTLCLRSVGRRSLTAEERLQSHASICETGSGEMASGQA